MINREIVLNVINEINNNIPLKILDKLMVERVTENDLDEFMARYLTILPPNYLPVLEKDGNLYGVHIVPQKHWKESPWVKISHDSTEVEIICESFKYLPYAFFTSNMNMGDYVEEIIGPVTDMLEENLEKPDSDFISENIGRKRRVIKEKYTPENGANILSLQTKGLYDDEAIEIIEHTSKLFPDDTICTMALVYIRNKFGKKNSSDYALELLEKEIYQKNTVFCLDDIDTAPEILELSRKEALRNLPAESPFWKMKDTPYTSAAAVSILKEIAEDFHKMGEEQLALNQQRNAAMTEGIYGRGMNKEWCLTLAEQCDRVEKDSLAGALARYAAEVVHLGP